MKKTTRCIVIREKSAKNIAQKIKTLEKKTDMIEVWLPSLNFDLQALRGMSKKKMILAIKDKKEKGFLAFTEKQLSEVIHSAVAAKIDYIDIDLRFAQKILSRKLLQQKGKTKIIVSWHDFRGTPDTNALLQLYHAAQKTHPDFIKLIPTAQASEDIQNWIETLKLLEKEKRRTPLITFQMGKIAQITRWLSIMLGWSPWIYIAEKKGKETAEGQITLAELVKNGFRLYF